MLVIAKLNDPEFALLIATTARPIADRHRTAITTAVGEADRIDWGRFLRLVDRHRVAPLAFDALVAFRDDIPAPSFADLRGKAMRDRAQALRSVGVLARVTACLADAGIDAISIKGPVLAQLAFGDPSARQSRDIDVLISEEAIARALTALETIGCRPVTDTDLSDPRRHGALVRLIKDISLVHAPSGVIVELHWRLSNNPRLFPSEIAQSRQTVLLGNFAVTTLAPDDLLLYLSVHGAKHYWFRLKWLADVYALIAGGGGDRFETFFRRAADRGLAAPAAQTLLLLESVYGLPLTAALRHEAQRTWRVRRLKRAALKYMTMMREPDEQWHVPYVMLLGHVGFRSELGYIAREIAGLMIDLPTLIRMGGTRHAYLVSIIGRPFIWGARRTKMAVVRGRSRA